KGRTHIVIPFFKRFYVKLSTLFLVLLLTMGAAQVLITIGITEKRQVEIDQLVNWELAKDMVAEIEPILDKKGGLGDIGPVIHYMMVLNPAIEIYVLDEGGRILAFFADSTQEVKEKTVSLKPIREFIGGKRTAPIYGNDPRNPGRHKHFSVAPLTLSEGSQGYLYIVLRSTLYDVAAGRLREKYLASALIRALILSIACVGVVGLILFFFMTRRLQGVARSVREFEQGNFDGRVDIATDDEIGELGRAFNRMADTIAANLDKLKQTDGLRRELIANVSHDLRSPLTSIQGYVETLLMKHESLDRDQIKGFLQIILSDATTLNEMVHELFELSKFEARQIDPKLERVSLTELAQDVIVRYEPQAEKLGVDLLGALPKKLLFVRADIRMIERVLSNLIENALEHTPPEGKVTLELRELAQRALVQVRDSGKGIPKEDIPFIFERFFTSDKGRYRDRRGSGLGLTVAQKIMELHGSRIEAESEPGKGSVFYFELPLDAA
ncbi:MAG TPA: HAMP domain-containing sensor histidine kinase, partial [Spirochaetia bacterium]|nr:HAMP domain-containing sensor histidine kinase [Spirochaetia bacterium]